MSLTEALSRISQIQTQIATLNGGLASPTAAPSLPAGAAIDQTAGAASAPGSFADALTQAQGLGPAATGALSTGQAQFASRLAAQTGLDPQVISAWLLAE